MFLDWIAELGLLQHDPGTREGREKEEGRGGGREVLFWARYSFNPNVSANQLFGTLSSWF
jgi:hypothetical protein